jgi:hypothetical protein
MNEQKQIVQDAIFQLACALEQIHWSRGVLHVLRDRLGHRKDCHYANVTNLALYNVKDWRNQLDCEMEMLERRTVAAFSEAICASQHTQ